jgi:chloramphenicol 3-O phosphotransferase
VPSELHPIVILLNGTSSSGKTSIAKALQERLLPRIFLNFSIDSVLYALPPSALKRMTSGQDISDLNFWNLVRSYYGCANALARQGNNLILDDAVTEEGVAKELMASIGGFRTCLVGVHCDLTELTRRERGRGDRTIGEAEWQFAKVHQHLRYDFEVDSTRESVGELAGDIVGYLKERKFLG